MYGTYSNEINTKYNSVANKAMYNKVPDYSNAGYKGGGKQPVAPTESRLIEYRNSMPNIRLLCVRAGTSIPFVKTKVTVSPGQADAAAAIQAAIDQVSSLPLDPETGFRGAVLIKAGQYKVSLPLTIATSGVVVRGQGSGASGGTTIIYTSKETQSDTFTFGSAGGATDTMLSDIADVVDGFVPVGTKTLTLSSTSKFSVGDRIIVELTPNMDWIKQMSGMDQWGW